MTQRLVQPNHQASWARHLRLFAALSMLWARAAVAAPPSETFPDEPTTTEAEEEPALPAKRLSAWRRGGLWARLIAERASVRTRFDFEGSIDSAGVYTKFARTDWRHYRAWGARSEVGYLADFGTGAAFIPRGAFSVLHTEAAEHAIDVVDVEHRWRSQPWWWSASVGVELQFFRRIVGISGDIGVAGMTGDVTSVSPDEANVVTRRVNAGMLFRLAPSLRVPLPAGFSVGLIGAAEGYLLPTFSSQVGGKSSLGLFVEWREPKP